VLGSCATTAELLDVATGARPQVCVVDVDLAGGGLTAVRALLAARDGPRVVVTAGSERADDLLAALRAGADGYVVKAVDARVVATEVAALARGEAGLSARLTACLIAELRRGAGTSTRRRDTRCRNR
jgi:two-component system nitrate/nitrite response regulator NarL